MYELPLYRLAGLYAPANGEFTTPGFVFPTSGRLWLNADVSWGGSPVTGGCDEGCAAYVMVELQDASTGLVMQGFERTGCKLMNTTGLRLPLNWKRGSAAGGAIAGREVVARVFFRDAIVYALGASS